MFAMFRKIFSPNAHNRRVMAGFCAAFVLTTIAFSSIFISAEADHDCNGHDCPICLEMQNCVANLQLVGSATPTCNSPLPSTSFSAVEAVPCARCAPVTTLQSLDVRFDE